MIVTLQGHSAFPVHSFMACFKLAACRLGGREWRGGGSKCAEVYDNLLHWMARADALLLGESPRLVVVSGAWVIWSKSDIKNFSFPNSSPQLLPQRHSISAEPSFLFARQRILCRFYLVTTNAQRFDLDLPCL